MAKYVNKRPEKRKFWTIILVVVLVIFILIAAVFGFLWSKLDLIQFADEIDDSDYYRTPATDANGDLLKEPVNGEDDLVVDIEGLKQVEAAPLIPESEIFADENVLNILLIGTDERTNEFNVNARSDSMIIVSIDQEKNTVKLVSLERGIGVPILEGQYEGQYDLLTHVFRYGGSELLMKTVEHCFKIDVDHYVRLNFNSVKQVVDTIGGIDVEFTKAEADYLGQFYAQNSSTGTQQPLKTGLNHLDGGNALAYARLRAIDSDWKRVGRQRTVIIAVVEALKGSSLLKLNELADVVLLLVQTNLTKMEIAELILYAPNFLQAEFDQMTIPKQGTYGGMSIMGGKGAFAVDYEVNLPILHEFLYGAEAEISETENP